MEATYRALCEHGFADLTMQRIADHSSKSKAALHYHYDTKEELLQAFLDYVASRFEAELATDSTTPERQLESIIEAIYGPAVSNRREYATALLAIKAQAPYDERFRTRLQELDQRLQEAVASAVRDGVEQGTFADADPQQIARFVATVTNGAHARSVALGEDPAETRALLETYLETELGIDMGEPA